MSIRKTLLSKFDYDVDDLNEIDNVTERELAVRAITENRTTPEVLVIEDLKIDDKWKPATPTIAWQTPGCNKTSQGGVVFGEKDLKASKIQIHTEFCNDDLIGFWPQLGLPQGSSAERDEMPFQDQLLELFIKYQNNQVSTSLWQGNTVLLNPNLNKFDGFAKRILNSSTTIQAGAGNITATNALQTFADVANAIPSSVFEENADVKVFCSHADFKLLLTNIRTLNLFHFAPNAAIDLEMEIPGTGVRAYVDFGVPQGYLFAGRRNDFMQLTNINSEINEFRLVYDDRSDLLILKGAFYLGTQIGFDEYIVYWTPASS